MKRPPLVVDYLRTHSLAELQAERGVKASIGTRPYKASFNYDQLAARDDDALACECRGLVLATPDGAALAATGVVGETVVLARPMDRFFNHGQGAAPALDLADPATRVFEKLDGTLCLVYHDEHAGAWCVATRAVPDADRPIGGFDRHTFRSLFEAALGEHLGLSFADLTATMAVSATYCFELTTPHNRIVVDHAASRVHLLAVRYRDGEEVCPLEMPGVAWPVAPSHGARSADELLAFVAARPPTRHEGVVVRMAQTHPGPFRRVKVKSAAYLAAAHLTESVGASPRSMMTVLLADQFDDVAPLLAPRLRARGEAMRTRLAALFDATDAAYARIRVATADDPNPRKAFALAVQARGEWLGPMMERYAGRCDSLRGYVANQHKNGGWSDSFLDTMLERLALAEVPARETP